MLRTWQKREGERDSTPSEGFTSSLWLFWVLCLWQMHASVKQITAMLVAEHAYVVRPLNDVKAFLQILARSFRRRS